MRKTVIAVIDTDTQQVEFEVFCADVKRDIEKSIDLSEGLERGGILGRDGYELFMKAIA